MRDIRFYGDISRPNVENLLHEIQRSSGERRVWINSNGGSFEFFSVLAPPLGRMGFTSIGEDVRSAATILFMLGHQRIAVPDATFFFHEVMASIEGLGIITLREVEELLDLDREASRAREGREEFFRQMRYAQDWYICFLSDVSGIPRRIFLSLMRANATLSAREAVHYGIAHRIASEEELFSC